MQDRPRRGPSVVRLHYIDGLRALAALWVVCNHAYLTIYPNTGGSDSPGGIAAIVTSWMVYGHFAVVAFMVLSGYSLAISTTRHGHRLERGFADFVHRRFTRIVLPYWGALLISLVLALTLLRNRTGTHWDAALPVTVQGVVLHATLLQDIATTGQINHAMWSIAIEWHIYFLFPFILWLRRRMGLLRATGLVIAIGVLISARFAGGLTLWEEANLVGCFAMGVAARELAVLSGRVQVTRKWSVRLPWGVLATVLTATIMWLCVTRTQTSNTLTEPLVAAATGCLLIALAAPGNRWLVSALSFRPLAWVGSFSYSVYLLHAPLLQLLWLDVMRPLGLPLQNGDALATLLALGVPASLGVGWCYFRTVERRCLAIGKPQHRPS